MKIMVLIFALMLAGCAGDRVSSRTKRETVSAVLSNPSATRGSNRDATGPEQLMLWYGAAPTSRQE
jgi:hypothetical protein